MSSVPPPHSPEAISRFLGALWHFNRTLAKEIEPLLEKELHTDSRSFLLLKSIQGGLAYPKLLAQEFKIPTTLISRYLDDLTKRGLVERHIDAQDSRRIRLTLTPAGSALLDETERVVHHHMGHRLARLSAERLDSLNDAITALAEEGSPV
ncbi:MarR family winged helix-turn-helix transcriptional regulator [Deinococcus hohokamensis]|uniref:MarR family winged helix-turn-helix transcriptional regulator n=1 Tax=Deinococcus hohokamensis TaxID=309883 RepID=A0ABV9IF11_9DEIO